MIDSLTFRYGSKPGSEPLVIKPSAMTVIVGPNNSGKSQLLRELRAVIFDGIQPNGNADGSHASFLILKCAQTRAYEREAIRAYLFREPALAWNLFTGQSFPTPYNKASYQVNFDHIEHHDRTMPEVIDSMKRERACFLGGAERLQLVTRKQAGPLLDPPRSILQAILMNDERRKQLQQAFYDAFGDYVVIDPTYPGQLGLRRSVSPPPIDVERSFSNAALQFFRQTRELAAESDGVKAFTGILVAALCADLELMLVDEPEAFLHPPLAKRLGQFLTQTAKEQKGTFFAATHSAHFLSGCIQAGPSVSVVRLTYERGEPGARLLSNERITTLMRDPLLRSSGVLSALFHRGAVVCEADTDRAFYAEINDRLLSGKSGGSPDVVFLNAQNWQTCGTIAGPLREMGIPTAMIVDLDAMLDRDFARVTTAAYVPSTTTVGIASMRSHLKIAFERAQKSSDTGKQHKRYGLGALAENDRLAADDLIRQLSLYGIFVVTVGELERWLPHLAVPGHGSSWLIAMFERMKNDPDDPAYLQPDAGDVWQFMRSINTWLIDPNRLGMPA